MQEQSYIVSARYAQDRSPRAPVAVKPFQIRGRFLTALALRIETETADAGFYDALDEHVRVTPQFFADAPVVLDFERVSGFSSAEALQDLVVNLRRRNLLVFGVQNADGLDADLLQRLGLIPVAKGRDAPAPQPSKRPPERRVPEPRRLKNKVVAAPVRSGQMVVAQDGDLTVIGSVASGAELMASGNIHVYGTLRGRAMAGVHGDESARIFCQKLDAELVAIAGLYQTSETLGQVPGDRCMQIFLENEKLRMEALA